MTAPPPFLPDDLTDLLVGRRPDGRCLACNHNAFIVTSGVPDVAEAGLERETALLRAADGDQPTDAPESFEHLVHQMRCQRCGYVETVFLPPIDPPLVGAFRVVLPQHVTAETAPEHDEDPPTS